MLSAHTGVPEHAAGDQIRQQLIPVGADLLPALRVARFLLVKDQLLRADIKKRCGKYLCMDAPALLLQLRPVDLTAVCIRIDRNIAHLPDAEAAVQEMLKGMYDQVEQMFRMAHCIDLRAVYLQRYLSVKCICKQTVELAVRL